MKRLRQLARILSFLLLAAAILRELAQPAPQRQWHGKLFGFIPYEFRPPTVQRLRQRVWNPEDPRIFTEHFFGVGWTINLASVLKKARRLSKGRPRGFKGRGF